jgi:putative transposase
VDHSQQEQVALHRWAVIAEAAGQKLTAAERGALVRQVAARAHTHPDGSSRRYSRGTIDRWLRAWRKGGLDALKPSPRADTGVVRAHPELFAEAAALRLELPGRSAAQIASILYHRHGIRVAERTIRAQLRRAGLHREAPGHPRADEHIGDPPLVAPGPLLVDGRFFAHENARLPGPAAPRDDPPRRARCPVLR